MTEVFNVSDTINADIDAVWSALTDWDRAPAWMTSVDALTIDGPTREGAQLAVRARGRESVASLSTCEPPSRLTMVSVQGQVEATYSYSLSAVGTSATTVQLAVDCTTSGPMLAVMGPLLRRAIRRADSGQVSELKSLIESS